MAGSGLDAQHECSEHHRMLGDHVCHTWTAIPQFVAAEFDGFIEYLGIQHTKGVPYWPQSNVEVERLNKTTMKAIKIVEIDTKHRKEEVQNFPFQYRMTPHTFTGISPAEMLMGRKLRNKLPKMQCIAHG